jgi:hypothetical protein
VFSYGGGTRPWNKAGGSVDPTTEDGMFEVIGLTTYQLVSLLLFYVFNEDLFQNFYIPYRIPSCYFP